MTSLAKLSFRCKVHGSVECHSHGLMPFADLAGTRRSASEAFLSVLSLLEQSGKQILKPFVQQAAWLHHPPEASHKARAPQVELASALAPPCSCGGLQYLQDRLAQVDVVTLRSECNVLCMPWAVASILHVARLDTGRLGL